MKLLKRVLNVIGVCGLDEMAKEIRFHRDHLQWSGVYIELRTKADMLEMYDALKAYGKVIGIQRCETETGVRSMLNEDCQDVKLSQQQHYGSSVADDRYYVNIHKKGDGMMISNKHDWSRPEALEQGKTFLTGVEAGAFGLPKQADGRTA